MPKSPLRATFLVALLAGALGMAAPAHAADTPFSTRYAQTLHGNIEAVGNTLLTCPASATCTQAQNRTGSSANWNNNYNMRNVDVDADATTFNSSSATVTLPAGATVVWAGLYWSADTSAGTGGLAAPTPAARDTVRFQVGSGSYQTVTAAPADLLTATSQPTRFRAFADVTSLLPAGGSGSYTVANVQAGRGDDRFAGWSLLIAYRDSAQAVHRLSVFDGLGTVDATHAFSTTISPFFTPSAGAVATKVGLLSYEGDAGLATESMSFNGSALTDALNPANNPLNSTIATDGVYLTTKNPNYNNQLGIDIDTWNRTGLLANGQSSADLSFTSTQDYFMPSALWLVTDEGPAVNTGGPTVGGVARDGSTLTADPGTWAGTPTITYQYQWQRCDAGGGNCVDIPGATGATYTLTAGDVGSTLRVLVTAVNDAGSTSPVASATTTQVAQLPPSNVVVPAVSGVVRDGQTLTTTLGGWNGTDPLDYAVQWQRCDATGANCTDIANETAWSYVLGAADVGATIRSQVTASNAAGSASAVSAPTGTVDPDPPVNTIIPTVSGAPRDGQTLTAATGTWTGTDPLSYAYQWQRCDADGSGCADLAGETGATYGLTGADIGHAVRVQVTSTNVAGQATASSSPTGAVVADPPTDVAAPTLSGAATDGHTLTLDDGTWTGTGPLTYDHVWQRCDAAGANCQAIAGETGTSYTLTVADIGATIRAVVAATNVAGVTAVQTTPTAVIAADPPVNAALPTASGTAVDGQTLSAGFGTWTGTDPIAYTYQWQRCDGTGANCADIGGETAPTYTLTGADIGQTVRVVVTGANPAGSATAASPATGAVAADPPANVAAPTTAGTARDGEVLTADPGSWSGTDPIALGYQWERCDAAGANCQPIAGATDPTYTLGAPDAGHTVRVVVTGTNVAGADSATSAPTATVDGNPPANVADPTLAGTARDGQTLVLDDGDWTGTAPLAAAYQWQRCDATGANCADLTGETGPSYTLRAADVDGTVRAVVTVTNAAGTASEATAASAVVLPAPPAVTIDPGVAGTAVDGQTVTADPGVWAGTAPVTFAYQWLRCDLDGTNCAPIAGATAADYTLAGADAGHGLRVEVTATNAAGSATATSPVAAIDAAAPQNTTPPSVTGSLVDAHTLTADPGAWSGTGPLAYDYQWLRCDAGGTNCVAIAGATGATYSLAGADIGHEVRVSVAASNAAGSAQATSAPTSDTVTADPPHSTSPPVLGGSAQDGATLTADTGGWSGTAPIAFAYQWQRCDAAGATCADIAGASTGTYTLTSADVGGTVRVAVTGTNAAGNDTATSAPTAAVAATAPTSTSPPTVSGTAVDGQTLIAGHGAFSGTAPMTYGYQWQRCDTDGTNCADIQGATGTSYDLAASDVGGAIVVIVTATNAAGSDTAASAATTEVLALAPANVTAPTVSGALLDGHTVTADPGAWSGTAPLGFGYQWQRCNADGSNCADILGATGSTYTLVAGDIDHVLRVTVTASNVGGSALSSSAATAVAQPDPPANAAAPTVSGTLEDGSTLAADTGAWTGTGPIGYAYQWQRCDADGTNCADIPGATSSTYDLTGADVGHAIVVDVTASNAAGQAAAASTPGARVAVEPPSSTVTPAAGGTAVDGQTLTADPGTWTGTGPIGFTYQWQRCDATGANCVDVIGATDPTYTLDTADLGATVRVVVTADNGEQATLASPAVGPIAPAPPVSLTVPTVAGTAGAGHTLTAGDGTWDGSGPIAFSYQWQRCDAAGANCADVAGATAATYDLGDADVGQAIRVEVTATNAAGHDSAVSAPTAATLPAPPLATGIPAAPSGSAVDGGTLTADPGTWSGAGPIDYSYQWQRCDADGTNCADIAGATGDTYSPTGADAGHAVVVQVTGTNPGGATSQASAPTAPVAAAPPVNATAPTIAGSAADGGTLTADPGTWTGTNPIDYAYQWQRCDADGTNCTDIAGATDDTYSAVAADVGHAIAVVVTASNAGGQGSQAAAASPVVVASPPHDTVAPGVSGAVGLGQALTAGDGTWTGTGPIGFTYQWQRCDEAGANCVDIAGATDDTYTLTQADQGHTVVVVVTAANAVGSDTATSAPSAMLPAPPLNTAPPSISGENEIGQALTADPGTWSGTGPLTYTYQWQRCDFSGQNCVDIAGATDDTYTLTDEDEGHTFQVVVTAGNAVGTAAAEAPTTTAVGRPSVTPTPTPTPTPSAAPAPAPKPPAGSPSGNGAPAGPVYGDAAFGGAGGDDLGTVPGSLVSDVACQQLAGNSKYRRVRARGIGTVRVRAYSTGPATKLSPVRVTTQITHGKARKVAYTLDGRRLRARRKGWKAAITPQQLQNVGVHRLAATVRGRKKHARRKVVTLTLKTVPCRMLFTAQRWRTTAGYGLRLRIDARTALEGVTFRVPAALLPRRVTQARTVGFMRVFVAGEGHRRRYALRLARKGKKAPLVRGAGKPTVKLRKRGLSVSGLPVRSAVVELTLYRVKRLDGSTKRRVYRFRARVAPTGVTLRARPQAPR